MSPSSVSRVPCPAAAFVTPTPVPLLRARAATPTSPTTTWRRRALVHPSSRIASPPSPTSPPPPTLPSRRPSSFPAGPCSPILGRVALQDALRNAPQGTPIVVFFHARWCRVCKTLAAKLPGVATRFPQLTWLHVDFAALDNKPLCHALNVRLLPTFRLYWAGALDVDHQEDFTTGPFGSKRLVERLEQFFDNANR